jgi:hypothetical protein
MSEEMKEADISPPIYRAPHFLNVACMPQPHIDEIKSNHQLEGKVVVFNL